MTAKTISPEKLLSKEQKDAIREAMTRNSIIQVCKQIPEEQELREAHRKFFCKYAYEGGVEHFGTLPEDYQDTILNRVLRKYTLTDLYFRYKESFFLKCIIKIFSRSKFDKCKFVNEMFMFMSDEGTVALLKEAEKLTTDSKALKRMKKVRESYSIQEPIDDDE